MSDPHRALGRALLARGGAGAAVLRSTVEEWASMTFEGHRHTFALEGADPAFGEGIGEVEFRLPGHIVADIAVRGGGGAELHVEALTLRDR